MNTTKKFNKALELFGANKLVEARKALQRITRADRYNIDAWRLLGMTEARLGKFADAANCFQSILSITPGSADAHYYLGAALEGQYLYPEAIREYATTLRIQPAYTKALYNLGNIYTSQGLLEKAEEYYRKALQHNPDHFETLNNLGSLLKTLSRLEMALQSFEKALTIKPGDVSILTNLGNTYHLLEDYSQAEKYYLKAINAKGATSEAYCGLSGILYKQGRKDEAQKLLQDGRQKLPGDDSIVASQAVLLEQAGQPEDAYNALKDRLDNNCGSVDIAVAFAKFARQLDLENKAVDLLENLLNNNQSASDRMRISFLLGKLYDGMKQHGKAYDQYRTGNKLKPIKLDRNRTVEKFDQLISVFNNELLSTVEVSGNKTDKPVFVIGMPRSGTSLVEQILSSHPEAHGAGELMDIGMLIASMQTLPDKENSYPACVPDISAKRLAEFSDTYKINIDKLAPDAARVIDKMPGNFLHLGFIQMILPGARIIHCMRNPLDNCLSCYFTDFLGYHPYAYDQADLGFYYCQYLRLMNHWQEVTGLPLYTVQYENLVNNQEAISREMIDFCGLPWDESCLEFHKTKRLVKTASYDQVRRPMYKSAIGRAEPYRDRIGALIEELENCSQ
jgi:tetratricopeptide (TPR) repeat protein